MKSIMVDNTGVKKADAVQMARDYYKKNKKPVEVCNAIGDTIMWIRKDGKEIWY